MSPKNNDVSKRSLRGKRATVLHLNGQALSISKTRPVGGWRCAGSHLRRGPPDRNQFHQVAGTNLAPWEGEQQRVEFSGSINVQSVIRPQRMAVLSQINIAFSAHLE